MEAVGTLSLRDIVWCLATSCCIARSGEDVSFTERNSAVDMMGWMMMGDWLIGQQRGGRAIARAMGCGCRTEREGASVGDSAAAHRCVGHSARRSCVCCGICCCSSDCCLSCLWNTIGGSRQDCAFRPTRAAGPALASYWPQPRLPASSTTPIGACPTPRWLSAI